MTTDKTTDKMVGAIRLILVLDGARTYSIAGQVQPNAVRLTPELRKQLEDAIADVPSE